MLKIESASLKKYTNDFFGKYLNDDNINEIAYNGGNDIFYQDTSGKWHIDENTNFNYDEALAFATACASFKKDSIDKTKSILSCVLINGERVQILIPPATNEGIITITIRKPSKVHYTIDDYIKNSYIDKDMADFIATCVKNEKNIVICGETGSGKTTFMKALIDFIPENQRILTIEDVPELKFSKHKNVVRHFYPSEAKGSDFLNATSLLKSALREKPDRILLAEVRGAETYDFLNVISSGHKGSMTSCHAGSVNGCIFRLVMMSMQNEIARSVGKDLILDTIKDTIDLIVVFKRENNGLRHITEYFYENEIYKNVDGKFLKSKK